MRIRLVLISIVISFSIALAFALIPATARAQADDAESCSDKALDAFLDVTYERNVTQVMELARRYIEDDLAAGIDGNPAVILDIDETSLSNRGYLTENDYCISGGALMQRMEAGDNTAIAPTLEFYRWARERGIAVFFMTGRPERLREATAKTLEAKGFTGFTDLYLRPEGFSGDWREHKAGWRSQVEEKGYEILVNIGDQAADIDGGHARHVLLVPNPFYVSR